MKREAIFHNGAPPYLYLTARDRLNVRLLAARGDLKRCEIVFFTRTTPKRRLRRQLQCSLRDGERDYFETQIQFPKAARYLKYYFELEDKEGAKCWLGAWGIQEREPEDGFYEFLYANEKECIRVPEWSKGQVWYQIFPDRFCNGKQENDPPGCVPWGSRPDREHYMGGDIAGILSKLSWLEGLGAECLYLTPVFKADFNHKYATEDYFEVDPAFGSKEDLKRLVQECHSRGIRVVLDGVFNHCGTKFPPFVDLLDKQESSQYRDWFLVSQYPVTISEACYECVGAYRWMPRLNTSNREVRQFILKVMRFWIEQAGIDGWRLDVADEVDESVWTQARIELKEAFPDVLLLGETWGSGVKMMRGDQMDSIMNYGFRDAVRDFIAWDRLDARGFDERFQHVLAAYPTVMQNSLYDLLDSHDTERFLTLCRGNVAKMKLAAALQLLLPGAPAIYYGDEIGTEGENDPDCRRAFAWEKAAEDDPVFVWYRELIALRKEEAAIRRGSFGANLCEGMVYGFLRSEKGEDLYAVCNAGAQREIGVPVKELGSYEIIFPKELRTDAVFTAEAAEGGNFYNGDMTDYAGAVMLTAPEESVFVIKKKQNKEERV